LVSPRREGRMEGKETTLMHAREWGGVIFSRNPAGGGGVSGLETGKKKTKKNRWFFWLLKK